PSTTTTIQTAFSPPSAIRDDWTTWAVCVLPYVEQDNLFKKWDQSFRYNEQPGPAGSAVDPAPYNLKVFFCPSRRTPTVGFSVNDTGNLAGLPARPGGLSDYAVNVGNNSASNRPNGAMMFTTAIGVTPAGAIITNNCDTSPA